MTPAVAVQHGEITADPTVEEKANVEMGEEISEIYTDSEEQFDGIYIDDGYVIVEFNPWWEIPLAVIVAKLKAAGVAITGSTIKAGALLMAAGKRITKANVDRVIRAWPTIRKALIRMGIGISLWALGNATWEWLQGNCISCDRTTPGGSWGDIFCGSCARRFGQLWA